MAKIRKLPDGATVIETISRVRVSYPNGDRIVHDKWLGRTEGWTEIRPHGNRTGR